MNAYGTRGLGEIIGGMALLAALLGLATMAEAQDATAPHTVTPTTVEDRKAVFATVQARDVTRARARIGGTVTGMALTEGDTVTEGQELARVEDPKLQLQREAFSAQIAAARTQRDLARTTLNRVSRLRRSGAVSEARLDEARTALETATRTLAARSAERAVLDRRLEEGAVLAPQSGRVLETAVTNGSVVTPGEVIATIATDAVFLRLRIPERHAGALQVGDTVLVAPRGVRVAPGADLTEGTVRLVYPRMQNGRVVADVDVSGGLRDRLVGERVRAYVGTGRRLALLVPDAYVFTRHGLRYVRLADGTDVVVQTGGRHDGQVEVLTGLRSGDALIVPQGAHTAAGESTP